MTIQTMTLQMNTRGNTDIIEITGEVSRVLAQSKCISGIMTIFCPSSTSALTTIEYEPGCVSDLRQLFEEIVPSNRSYAHDERWGDANGFSHLRASLIGPSLTIPFINTQLTLGTWQQIIYLDFDNRPRHRELILQIIAE